MNKSENRKSRNLESIDHEEEERMLFETLHRIPRIMPRKSDENGVCLRTVSDKFFTDNTLNSAVLRQISECLYSIITVCQCREIPVHWICVRKDSKRNSTNSSREFQSQQFDIDAILWLLLDTFDKMFPGGKKKASLKSE